MSTGVFDDTDVPETFPQDMSLDPALLDPEMANYFLEQASHDPPPYSEVEPHVESHVDNHNGFSQRLLANQPEQPWMSHYDNSFETYMARPLSQPILHSDLLSPHSKGMLPTMLNDDRSKSISPSMLNKSSSISVQDEVVWYSSGREMQIGGKKPPRTKNNEEGKGKGKVLGKRRKTMDDSPSPYAGDLPIQDSPIERMRYEINVDTGLHTIKRIKLVFHDSSTDTSRPCASTPPVTCTNPVDVDCIPEAESKERDTAQAYPVDVDCIPEVESMKQDTAEANPVDVDCIPEAESMKQDTAEGNPVDVDCVPEAESMKQDTAEGNPVDVDCVPEAESMKQDTAEANPVDVDCIEVKSMKQDTAEANPVDVDCIEVKSMKQDTAEANPVDVDCIEVESMKQDTAEANPVDVDCIEVESKKQDTAQADALRITPPAAIEPDRSLPNTQDLFSDENTPPPTVSTERICKCEVIIPAKEIDKSMYPVFLGKDAKQTMIKEELDGRTKGVIFEW